MVLLVRFAAGLWTAYKVATRADGFAAMTLGDPYQKYHRPQRYLDDETVGHLATRVAERVFPADMDVYCKCREALHAAELEVPRIVSPLSGENQRLVNQRGLFTEFLKPQPLEDWVQFYFTDPPGTGSFDSDEPILATINIPNTEREAALAWLDAANINYLSLFPDLYGAAEFANTRV